MESIVTPPVIQTIAGFINTSKLDPKAEIECKLLAGKIQTKDVADRILKAIGSLAVGLTKESNHMTFSYPDSTRVTIEGSQNIHAICVSNSFKGIPLSVEKKNRYSDGRKDIIDVAEANLRFTLSSESPLGKDWYGNPADPKAFIRLLSRKSFRTADELFQIDFSMVKTRPSSSRKSIRDLLQQPHTFELEIEFVGKESKIPNIEIVQSLLKIVDVLSQAFHQSQFLLKNSEMQQYEHEFKLSKNIFYNPVTMMRRHISLRNPYNISKGYTVTNKADGERACLYVSRDRRVLKITPTYKVVWTGITARDDKHIGDFIDGEYIPDKNMFCIFDVYRFRKQDVRNLPLMTSEEDLVTNPGISRLGCGKLFIEDLKTDFAISASTMPIRIETKLFLTGDGTVMEENIRTMLTEDFGYETDGLIFTPKSSPVAPDSERKKNTWLRVYKWKPADQNSIDFLVKISPEETFDPILKTKARKGELYVSKSAGDDIVYPRETMNGEYKPREVHPELQQIIETSYRIPAVFQPSVPRDPDAYQILIPVNEKGITVDKNDQKVEDNTIIECVFDTETRRWTILRTRYDKTYQYRVLKNPQYGNDIATANANWTSIHVPITEDMIQTFISNPPDDTYEDDMYYRDDLKRTSRIFKDVYDFHNRVKDGLYRQNIKPTQDVLLELASGRAGDLHKWKASKVKKVVALDISLGNIVSPAQGAAVRYLKDKQDNPKDYRPPVLLLQGDMSVYPLFDQEDKYMPIVKGEQKASTDYLEQFYDIKEFDVISCQFAMHYACETDETFHAFAKNLEKYGKGLFFGTCLDGQAVYSLLMGKKTHLFGTDKQVAGEMTKEYLDKDTWTEEFGMPIKVYLESFEKPEIEYLVPFEKVTGILREHGYELVDSKMFSEIYSNQTGITLTPTEQTFSFLNRTFLFRRMSRAEVKEEKEPEEPAPETEIKEVLTTEEEKPKKRKLRKGGAEEPEPVLFFGSDESKGPHRNFSNMSEHPIDIEGEKFPTVEHYIQAMKAKEFQDEEMYNKIVKAKTPKAVKAMGQKVKNFVKEMWDGKRDGITRTAVRAKFTQHPELRKQLQETGDKMIGEADPRDTYWGIGTSIDSDKAKYPSKWRGQNKMGKMLMEMRTEFNGEAS
jgi:ribA/ribD-fused uncharacterized protein